MDKRKRTGSVLLATLLTTAALFLLTGCGVVSWLFSEQYNENGVSHFLVITIDKDQPKEYVGELDGYDVYMEGLNLDETNFRNVDAENVPVKDAIEQGLVSVDDWREYARSVDSSGGMEILKFENYEIVLSGNECIIRPLSAI